jgi:pyruvate,water dikinase
MPHVQQSQVEAIGAAAASAREFGKPCVAGIQGITTKLEDGQLVELDGTAGFVRILEMAL